MPMLGVSFGLCTFVIHDTRTPRGNQFGPPLSNGSASALMTPSTIWHRSCHRPVLNLSLMSIATSQHGAYASPGSTPPPADRLAIEVLLDAQAEKTKRKSRVAMVPFETLPILDSSRGKEDSNRFQDCSRNDIRVAGDRHVNRSAVYSRGAGRI